MEVEIKFGVPNEEVFERLVATDRLAGYRLMPGVAREIRDVYLDTPDGAVAAAGFTLRRRDWGDVVTVTLKQAAASVSDDGRAAVLRREEIEVNLAADPATSGDGPVVEGLPADGLALKGLPPGPLRRRLTSVVGARSLQPLVVLGQRRLARDAFDGDRLVAEVSLDTVTVQTASGPHRHFEIEAEMRPQAGDDDLQALSTCLREEWDLEPETLSKIARAKALVAERGRPAEAAPAGAGAGGGPTAPAAGEQAATSPAAERAAGEEEKRRRRSPGIEPDDAMSEAARKTILFHFQRMLAHEDGTRTGENYEELHDMRVATRRMRAGLAVFGPYVAEKAYLPHLKSLRKTGRLLGAVRDLDVFHEKAEQYLAELPEERRDELGPLFDAWRLERDKRRERMLEWLDGSGYRGFVDAFGAFLERRGSGEPPDFDGGGTPRGRRVNIALPPVVLTELANVLAYDEWVTGPGVPLARLHQLRIAAKYLRYTLEFFGEVLGPGGKLVVHNVKSLQDHLGDLQDAVVTSGILRDFLSGEGWGRSAGRRARAEQGTDLIVAPGVANYLAYKQMELARLVRTFPAAWDPIRAPRYRHTLLSLLGKL